VLSKIFGSNREEVAGNWRKFHNEELHNFQSVPNFVALIKENDKGRTRGTYGVQNTCIQGFGGKKWRGATW
jgi:hypothetical protein